nr:outer membrane protein transport protein [Legionella tunisiensis]
MPNKGNQINKVWGKNSTLDAGIFYKIDPRNYLTVAAYTPVNNKFGRGISSLGSNTVYNYSSNIVEASVAYIGLEHFITDKWFLEEKVYWSGWKITKSVYLVNKTNGTTITPANWRDVWSFQITSRYATTDKVAILGSVMYETNPVPTSTNQIGYPLAAVVGISTGLDLSLQTGLSVQILYNYGAFTPHSIINNTNSRGTVAANFQAFISQVIYKI